MLDATPANLSYHVWTIDELLRLTARRIRYFVLLPCERCDVYKSLQRPVSGEEREGRFIRTHIITPSRHVHDK